VTEETKQWYARRAERGLRTVLNMHSLILRPEASLNFALEFCVIFNTDFTDYLGDFTNFLVRIGARIKLKQHANEMNENMTQVKHELIKE
jgi:hypothetical protein